LSFRQYKNCVAAVFFESRRFLDACSSLD
jgi:hypothetical protein